MRRAARLIARLPAPAIESMWVSAGTYALYAAMFGVSILVNRAFGTAELGRFGIAWAAAQLTVQSGVSGFSALHRRDVAYRRRPLAELVAQTLGMRVVALATLVGTTWVALALLPLGAPVRWAVGWMVLAKAVEAIGSALAETMQAEGHNRTYALISVGNAAALVFATGVVWALEADAPWLYPALAGAALLYASGSLAAYVRVHGWPGVRLSREGVGATMRESWPLVVNALVVVAAARVAVLAVGALSGEEAAGVYTFASGVVGGAAVVASAIGTVLFPRLCAQFVEAPETLRGTLRRLVPRLAVLGVGAALAVLGARGWLVALYGDLPPESPSALAVLALSLVPVFAGVAPNYLFTAIGAQRDGMRFALVQAAVLVALVLPLASRWGVVGAAAGVAATPMLGVPLAVVWLERRYLGPWARRGPSPPRGQKPPPTG